MDRRRPLVITVIVVGAMVALGAWAWIQLPAGSQVPIHWGASGEPDGFADKTIGLFLLPAITAGIGALMWVIPVIEPRRANFEKSGKAYQAIWLGVVALMGAIQVVVVATALGTPLDMTFIVFLSTGLLFIVIGNYLPKVRPNYLMGIRTPWTLTSDLSWDRTHRVGGRLFVLEGVLFIVIGLLRPPPEAMIVVLIGAIVAMLVFVFAYSYRVWKFDPAKRGA